MAARRSTYLRRATYRTLHSIKRRAAGEHNIPTQHLVHMYATEWGLDKVDTALLQLEVNKLEHAISQRRST